MESDQIQRHIRNAVRAAVAISIASAVILVLARALGTDARLEEFGDWWGLVDIVVVLILAWGVRRRSRTAAVSLVLFYILSQLVTIASGSFHPLPFAIALLILYFFIRGMQATFAWHNQRRKNDAGYDHPPRLVYLIVAPTVAIGFSMLLWTTFVTWGLLPDVEAIPGEDLKGATLDELHNMGVAGPDDGVLYFYSDGLASIREDGNFFTPDRVVSYETIDDSLHVYSADFDDITNIFVYYDATETGLTALEVRPSDTTGFYLVVSPEADGDHEFIRALDDAWKGGAVRLPFEQGCYPFDDRWDLTGIERGAGHAYRDSLGRAAALYAAEAYVESYTALAGIRDAFEAEVFDSTRVNVCVTSQADLDRLRTSNPDLGDAQWVDWTYCVALQHMARFMCDIGYAAVASELLDDIVRRAPLAAEPLIMNGYAHMMEGDPGAALACYDIALERAGEYANSAPYQAQALRAAGSCLIELGRFQGAVDRLDRSLGLDPGNEFAERERRYARARLAAADRAE